MNAHTRDMRVAVIGAGIAGIGIGLELAARGIGVDLHERTPRVHGRASLANEGKMHLGYIYANDPTLRTARQMVEGAWTFAPILRQWLERDLAPSFLSVPFHYLVHRESLIDPGGLAVTYRRIAELNREMSARPGTGYFGREGASPPRLLSTAEREFRYGPDVLAAFETPEVAVDTEAIGEALSERVTAEPRIELRLGSEVLSATPEDRGASLVACYEGRTETLRYDHVVNASWEDLVHLDATAGLPAPPGSSFRLRRILRIRGSHGGAGVGSSSVVLGAFGDLVEYGGGDLFLSWYPVGRRAMTTLPRPPADWWEAPGPEEGQDIQVQTFAALRRLIPGLDHVSEAALTSATVHSGVVYARGTTDISDPGSGYHERYEIGPRSFGDYHSVDTGKYTTAPLFARQLADRIAGERH